MEENVSGCFFLNTVYKEVFCCQLSRWAASHGACLWDRASMSLVAARDD